MSCQHKWKITHGMFRVYKDCELCGIKFEDVDKSEKKAYVFLKNEQLLEKYAESYGGMFLYDEPAFTEFRHEAAPYLYKGTHFPAIIGEKEGKSSILIYTLDQIFELFEKRKIAPKIIY